MFLSRKSRPRRTTVNGTARRTCRLRTLYRFRHRETAEPDAGNVQPRASDTGTDAGITRPPWEALGSSSSSKGEIKSVLVLVERQGLLNEVHKNCEVSVLWGIGFRMGIPFIYLREWENLWISFPLICLGWRMAIVMNRLDYDTIQW